jgi:plastocyanin/mono/diheme cytochrome c family protein
MNTGKQINAMIALLLLLLLTVGIYTIWDPFRAEATKERTQENMAERAAKTFTANCRMCHGNEGEGRIGPALNPKFRQNNPNLINFADPDKLAENRALVRNILTCGRIGTIMPAWSQDQGGALTSEQIRRLVILITEPPEGSWERAKEFAEEAEAEGVHLPPVDEITRGATITGSTSPVCGQRAAAAPTPAATPSEFKQMWTIVATDNKFDITAIGVAANQPVTLTLQNRGAAIHNWSVQGVRGTNNEAIETQLLPGGQSQTITFTIAMPGTYRFLCTVHPTEMVGTLVVQ